MALKKTEIASSQLLNNFSVNLDFSDLGFMVRDTTTNESAKALNPYNQANMKWILKDISGSFRSGELTALMGPSGAGKSTLMNILAGYRTNKVQGTVSVNGKVRDLTQFRKMSCYIMQDDMLLPHLTVMEAMKFAAELKLPRSVKKEEKCRRIDEILNAIGLSGCSNVRTSNVSGGQRKRLAIALELINNPPIMFFDEPTSGLDSATCYSCVTLLKDLALGGRTIIATIHQPSAKIFEHFDSLYLLGKGQCLYRGPVKSFVSYMAGQGLQCPPYHNPADFAIEVASSEYGEHWLPLLAKASSSSNANSPNSESSSGLAHSSEADNGDEEVAGPSPTPSAQEKLYNRQGSKSSLRVSNADQQVDSEVTVSLVPSSSPIFTSPSYEDKAAEGKAVKFWTQFVTLLKRSFVCTSRDMMLTHLRFVATVLVGLLIGAIYHDAGSDADKTFNNAGNLFFGLLFMVFAAMMSTVLTFPLERGVLIREHLNCWYSIKAYYLARTIADLPFQLFFPLLYTLIMYYMTDQPQEAFRFWIVVMNYTLIALVAQSLGLLIGAACDIQSAVFIGPVSAIPIFLFGGFFVTLNAVPLYLRWISWFSYAKYAFQSTLTGVYGFDRADLNCFQVYCHFKNPKKFLEQIDASDIDIVEQGACLIGLFLACRVGAYFALKLKIMMEKQ